MLPPLILYEYGVVPPEAVKVNVKGSVTEIGIVTTVGVTTIAAEIIVTVALPVLPSVSVAVTVSEPVEVPAVKTPVVETIEPNVVLLTDHE